MALESTDSQLWVGIVTGIGGLTMFAFSPLAGVAVDRSNRRNLLVNVRIALMSAFLVAVAVHHSGVGNRGSISIRWSGLPSAGCGYRWIRWVLTANSLIMASFSARELIGPVIVDESAFVIGLGQEVGYHDR